MTVIEPGWEPPNPPEKIMLPTPVYFFTVGWAFDGDFGWKDLGPCNPRATCCGSRAELRLPGGGSKTVRLGGIGVRSVSVVKPQPVGDVPVGTEVWLLETEDTDYAALVHGDTVPLPLFPPVTNPVDREYRRQVRIAVDTQLEALEPTAGRELLADSRVDYPARLAEGVWVVYELPCGHRVMYRPDRRAFVVESLEGERTEADSLAAVVSHIEG